MMPLPLEAEAAPAGLRPPPLSRFPDAALKRGAILAACVLMLMGMGTLAAWSVFVAPLRARFGFSAFQMQLVFNTGVFTFCTVIVPAGRLHDRFGPRPMAAAGAVLIALAWTLAWAFGEHYFLLWLALGFLANVGIAVGYVAPLATAIKWFPDHRGLVSGLTAAGFAGGPIVFSAMAEALMRRGWEPSSIFGLVAATYAPAILLTGMALSLPPGQPGHADVVRFRRRELWRDRRFWTLFLGMLTGTLPFLVVMGSAKPMALDFGLSPTAAATAIAVLAAGNASGRILWGAAIDRVGPRRSMLTAQAIAVVSLLTLIAGGHRAAALFFASLFGMGFCYGSNFSICPATVALLYGTHVMGSIYPLIMLAQGVSSFAPTVNGLLKDGTGSYYPGLIFTLTIAVAGSLTCGLLSRPRHA